MRAVVFVLIATLLGPASAFALDPPDPAGSRAATRRGTNLLWQGQFGPAIAAFTEAITRDPGNAEAYNGRGLAHREVGEQRLAFQDFDSAVHLNPSFVPALVNRGNTYTRMTRYDDAVADFDRALRLEPDNYRAYEGRGEVFQARRDFDRALKDFSQALRLNPRALGALTRRAEVYLALGAYDQALADANRLLFVAPDDPYHHLLRGDAYQFKGMYEDAIEDYAAAIQIQPGYVAALVGRGSAALSLGRFDEALADFDAALAIAPTYPGVQRYRGRALAGKRDHRGALEAFDRAIAADPRDVAAFLDRADAHMKGRDPAAAIRDYTTASTLDPRSSVILVRLADVYRFTARYGDAFDTYEKAIKLDERDAQAYHGLGLTYSRLGQYDRAIEEYGKALQLQPRFTFAYIDRCAAFMSQRHFEQAFRDCDQAIAINPKDPGAYVARGQVHAAKRDHARAIEDYDAALRLDPEFAIALYARGQAKLKRGDRAGGQADIAAAKTLDKDVAGEAISWGGWQRRLREQAAGFDLELAQAIVYIAAGAVLVIVVIAETWAGALLPAALVGAVAGLLLSTALPSRGPLTAPDSALLFGFFLTSAVLIAITLAFVLTAVLSLRQAAGLRETGRRLLRPTRWPNAQPESLSTTDLAKRVFVTVSAAAGGVVGSLAMLPVFWENLSEVFTPQGIVATMVLTLVSVVLIRPLHEYVLDRGLGSEGHPEGEREEWPSRIWARISWRAVARLSIVFVCLIQLDLMYSSLDFCIQRGASEATFRLVFAGLLPGIVSYYWSAALQLGVRPLRRSVTLATFLMASLVWYPITVTRLTAWLVYVTAGHGRPVLTALAVLGAMVLALGAAALTYGLEYAISAFAGGYAIDRVRGPYVVLYVAFGLLFATLLAEGLAVVDLLVTGVARRDVEYLQMTGVRLAEAAGWIVGLFASSFPQLVRRGQGSDDLSTLRVAHPQAP